MCIKQTQKKLIQIKNRRKNKKINLVMIFLIFFTLLALLSSWGKQVKCFIFPDNNEKEVSLIEYLIKTSISIPYQLSMNANSNKSVSLVFILTTQFIVISVDQLIVNSNLFIRQFMFEGFTVIIMPIQMQFTLHLGCLYYKQYLRTYLICYFISLYLFYYTSIEYRKPIECITFSVVSVYSFFHALYLDYKEKTKDYIYYPQLQFKNENIITGRRVQRFIQFAHLPQHHQHQQFQNNNFLLDNQIDHSRIQSNHHNHTNLNLPQLKDIIYIGNYKGRPSVLQIYDKNIFIIKNILFNRKVLSNYNSVNVFQEHKTKIQNLSFDHELKFFLIYITQQNDNKLLIYHISNLQKALKIFDLKNCVLEEIDIDIVNKLFYYIDTENNLIETSYINSKINTYKINEGYFRHNIKVFNSSEYKVLLCYKMNSTNMFLFSLNKEIDKDFNDICMHKVNIYMAIKSIFIFQNNIVVVTDTLVYLFDPITFRVNKVLKDFNNFTKLKKSNDKLIISQTVETEDQFIIDNLINPTELFKSSNLINTAYLGDPQQSSTQILLLFSNDSIEIVQNIWVLNQKANQNNTNINELLKT